MSNGHITTYNYMFLDQSPQEDILLHVILTCLIHSLVKKNVNINSFLNIHPAQFKLQDCSYLLKDD